MASVIALPVLQPRKPVYRVGRFLLEPHRQLLEDGEPVQIGRKSLDILSVLAKSEGRLVTKDEMMAAVWPNAIVEENAIQAQIVAIRKVLGPDAELLSTARGLGYRLAVTTDPSAAGAPPAVASRVRSRALWIGLAAVAVIAAGAVGLWRLHARTPPAAVVEDGRIAMAPLSVRGADPNVGGFATALSDQIASALADAQAPLVSGGDRPRKTEAAGQQAALPGLLIGGVVRSDGKTLDVLVHLDDAREHLTVWSATFQGPASASKALQSRVAAHVANAAKWAEVGRSGRVKLDATSVAAFIAGREGVGGVSNAPKDADLADFRKVVALAPQFPWGHSGIALVEAFDAIDVASAEEAQRVRSDARGEARRALALDPHNSEAYLALEVLTPQTDWARREDLLIRGAAVDPGFSQTVAMEGRLLWATGRCNDAVAWLFRARGLDPMHEGATNSLVLLLASEGNIAQSRSLLAEAQSQSSHGWTEHARFLAPFMEGSPREALAILTDPQTQPPDMPQPMIEAWRTALAGIIARDRTTKLKAAKSTTDAVRSWQLYGPEAMILLASLGDRDAAMKAADAYQPGVPSELPYLFLPPAAPLRADPRFMKVAERLGLVAYWRKTGHWPDFCSEPGLPYDCKVETAKLTR